MKRSNARKKPKIRKKVNAMSFTITHHVCCPRISRLPSICFWEADGTYTTIQVFCVECLCTAMTSINTPSRLTLELTPSSFTSPMQLLLLLVTLLVPLVTSQYSSGQYGSQLSSGEPGYLPDYQGDKYTSPQRIKETQELNKAFFDTIGGPPPAPPLTPAQNGSASSGSTYSNQQPLNTMTGTNYPYQPSSSSMSVSGYPYQTSSGYQSQPYTSYQPPSSSGYQSQTYPGYQYQPSTGYQSQAASGYQYQPSTGYQSQTASGYQYQPSSGYEVQICASCQYQTYSSYQYQPSSSSMAGSTYPYQTPGEYQYNPTVQRAGDTFGAYPAQSTNSLQAILGICCF
ncbi:hypothetical protein GCK32_011142 [Trichostrongylus colubriformis]|uniref:Uncharacterized protein n=1 Tax=Trichostrongylus colubriformis TaxID=6319 RepID=A0AAN8FTC9_TRICO